MMLFIMLWLLAYKSRTFCDHNRHTPQRQLTKRPEHTRDVSEMYCVLAFVWYNEEAERISRMESVSIDCCDEYIPDIMLATHLLNQFIRYISHVEYSTKHRTIYTMFYCSG